MKEEHVHHKNGDSTDDRDENLTVLSRNDHTRQHWKNGDMDGVLRHLDYDEIKRLMQKGLGYKRIAKKLGESVNSVKSACRVIRRAAIAL